MTENNQPSTAEGPVGNKRRTRALLGAVAAGVALAGGAFYTATQSSANQSPLAAQQYDPGKQSEEDRHKEIAYAREAMKEKGIQLQRLMSAKDSAKGVVETRTETMADGGTVKVESAKHDLTGTGLALMAGDKGTSFGDGVKCTKKVRFSRDVQAIERSEMLVCWKTTKARSVVTMAISPADVPQSAESIAIINKEWAGLA